MRSFEYGYYLETPLSHALLMTMRSLGEFRGRQTLYADQSPEVLDTLRRVAIVQSTESSNRIEGITVAPGRVEALVAKKSKPQPLLAGQSVRWFEVPLNVYPNGLR